ncbi:MFS transporter [Streptomyces sp. AV19]|uniref:CynX/NimT family MFS transporter n=1 Tax=Streptomyces sp. AV19 TaxID=2793068 RepID=UPI001F15974C|nr:MFS transporter [Streptomyces sp. AV19]MDG4532520.1 MFS transporter [Streptomyces sp. AV19]
MTRARGGTGTTGAADGRTTAAGWAARVPARWWAAAGLVLAALNLRPAVTSLGSLMEEVRQGLGMSGTVAGLLTSVPSLCFALLGPAAPRLARRFGPAAVVCGGLAAIAAGLALRPFAGGTAGFLLLSALALAGIAVGNVLMPVVVKRWFPDRVGPMTGLYSMALTGGSAIAAASTVPVTGALGGGWRPGLAVWSLLALAAGTAWWYLARRPDGRDGPAAVLPEPAAPVPSIRRSPTAWALAVFFGLQSTGAYITMGWMPQIFRDAGVGAGTAGLLAAVTMLMGVPFSLLLPGIAARVRNQGFVALALIACGLAGYAGLWLAPAGGCWAWAVLLGIANSSFPLALTMIGMRARTGAGVVRLSAFAQSVGYLLSIPGPLLVGRLYQATGGWELPIALLAALTVPQAVAGLLAGRDRSIEDET